MRNPGCDKCYDALLARRECECGNPDLKQFAKPATPKRLGQPLRTLNAIFTGLAYVLGVAILGLVASPCTTCAAYIGVGSLASDETKAGIVGFLSVVGVVLFVWGCIKGWRGEKFILYQKL